jgi:hypothetical protein
MSYRSNVAAVAILTMVGLGVSGCGGGGGGGVSSAPQTKLPPVEDTPGVECPIPESVKQNATLDQNKTRVALNAALMATFAGWDFIDDRRMYVGAKRISLEKAEKSSYLSKKVKGLLENTQHIKNRYENSEIEYGDNLACDEGTYTLHEKEGEEEIDGVTESVEKLTLSFDNCILSETDDNADLIDFFRHIVMYTSLMDRFVSEEDVNRTYVFNGDASLEYNAEYSYQRSEWNDEEPTDSGSSSERKNKGTTHLVTNGLSVKYSENGQLKNSRNVTQDLLVKFDELHDSESSTTYDEDNNKTRSNTDISEYKFSMLLSANEVIETISADRNTTFSANALCFGMEGEWEYMNEYMYHYPDGSSYDYDHYKRNWESEYNSTVNGYLSLGSKVSSDENPDGLDVYAENLKVSGTRNGKYERVKVDDSWTTVEDDDNQTLSLNGRVGSTLMEGSAMLNTVTPWQMSNAYPQHKNGFDPELSRVREGYYMWHFPYTPYAGKTVLTGTNSAVVEFMYDEDDNNRTYGQITVGDEESVKYKSVQDLLYGVFEED